MRALDYAAFYAYLILILAMGLFLRRRDTSPREYFLAGRSMRWAPIGLSVMVTAFSAINYAALPAEVFGHGLYVLAALPVFALVALPVTRVFMPFFYPMRLTSAYAYLELRFDARVRRLASGLFILWRLFWMATALYASGAILCAVMGLDRAWLPHLILLGGAVATAYTSLGGMRAVMWTDVAQFVVISLGIVAAIGLAMAQAPQGWAGVVAVARRAGRLQPLAPLDLRFFSLDPTIRITLWSGLIGTLVAFLARYGADQSVVQRYFTARSLRDAQRGFWLNVAAAVSALGLLAMLGLAVYAHADHTGALGRAGWSPLRHMAELVRSLPAGACGLIAAGLLAATMSSVDSGASACCAAWMTDFHPRLFGGSAGDGRRLHRPLTLGLGAAAVLLALGLVGWIGPRNTLFAVVNKVVNGLGSPLLALFLLGMFCRRVNSAGMLAGGAIGAVWSVAVSFGVRGLALHYYAVVNLLGAVLACLVCSALARRLGMDDADQGLEWTWQARRNIRGDEPAPSPDR